MTSSSKKAINFDLLKNDYRKCRGTPSAPIASVDALLLENSVSAMVEFKNGILIKQDKAVKETKENIIAKIKDSLLIYCDLFKKTISDTRKELDFILVYNETKYTSEKQKLNGQLIKKKLFSELNLKSFEKIYFQSVSLYTKQEFELFLKHHTLYSETTNFGTEYTED